MMNCDDYVETYHSVHPETMKVARCFAARRSGWLTPAAVPRKS